MLKRRAEALSASGERYQSTVLGITCHLLIDWPRRLLMYVL
eukprot:SAG31_NODE_33489_length_343_cov_0.836066_2_plen_40_part_01